LHQFIEQEALPDSGISSDRFWNGLASILDEFNARTGASLQRRDELQTAIDAWHAEHPGKPDAAAYKTFLTDIGYLVPTPEAGVVKQPARSW